jgi:hypothetical protein
VQVPTSNSQRNAGAQEYQNDFKRNTGAQLAGDALRSVEDVSGGSAQTDAHRN